MYEENFEPEFKVFGSPVILEEMIINIESFTNDPLYTGYPVSKIQTQLYKGQQQTFSNDDVIRYSIYFSYNNRVGNLSFDNIYRDIDGHINHIYVFTKDDDIYLRHYGLWSDIEEKNGPTSDIALLFDNFFQKNNISDENDREIYKVKFFHFFDPHTQKYALPPLSKASRDYYRNFSLEERKNYNLPDEYINQLGAER